jgi:hypothetical protein
VKRPAFITTCTYTNRERLFAQRCIVKSGVEVQGMATISNRALSIFKDACGIQLNEILQASKDWMKKKAAH